MAPRINDFVREIRKRGALVIHCPSDTLEAYEGKPQRQLAQSAPAVTPVVPLQNWCGRDPEREPELPIDDADGGCTEDPPCPQGHPWTRQIDVIEIDAADAIADSTDVLNLMAARGIENAFVLGVHLNMCVLGRPFGIRQLVRQGKQVVLVRDLTDTMYNPRRRPLVSHFTGTDLMVEHVEKYWCGTVTSSQILGGSPFRFPRDGRPRVAVMIGEDEYETWNTLPEFVDQVLLPAGFAVTTLHERVDEPGTFPTLVSALSEGDLLVTSVRRRALLPIQMEALHRHLDAGRPLVAIRTSSHGFSPRGELAEAVENGSREAWTKFDAVVLGGNYHGHHGVGPITTVRAGPEWRDHEILSGIAMEGWTSVGSLYQVSPLAEGTEVLLTGSIPGQSLEPVAWTRRYGPGKARVFYTSLGHPEDFGEPRFRQLLLNAIRWGLGQ
jgi:nicotinamidase-related amidase